MSYGDSIGQIEQWAETTSSPSVSNSRTWRMPPGAARAKAQPPCGDPNHDIYGEPCPCTGEQK